jgi:hypothetical protein
MASQAQRRKAYGERRPQRPSAHLSAHELADYAQHRALLASLGPNDGYLTPSSSPHVWWLAQQLRRVGE